MQTKEEKNAYHRAYWQIPENHEKRRLATNAYRKNNREKTNMWSRNRMRRLRASGLYSSMKWYLENKERAKETHSKWCREHRKEIAAYDKKKQSEDPSWRIRKRLSSRINEVIKVFKGTKKAVKTMALVGCTRLVLMQWLESQFRDGMTWDNYGFYGWHIDHIRPCSSFDLTKADQLSACFHYTNLQPLWAEENYAKNDTWDGQLLKDTK